MRLETYNPEQNTGFYASSHHCPLSVRVWTVWQWLKFSWGRSAIRYWQSTKGRRLLTLERAGQRTSLVVQWLRLWAPNAGGLGSIPGQGTRSHMLQLKILNVATKLINKINMFLKRKSMTLWRKEMNNCQREVFTSDPRLYIDMAGL